MRNKGKESSQFENGDVQINNAVPEFLDLEALAIWNVFC